MLLSKLNKAVPASRVLVQPTITDVYHNVWYLNQHERQELDKYFMIIRSKKVFRAEYTDDELLLSTIMNVGIEYKVIFQGVKSWHDFQEDSIICTSFRKSKKHNIAVVLVRPYNPKRRSYGND